MTSIKTTHLYINEQKELFLALKIRSCLVENILKGCVMLASIATRENLRRVGVMNRVAVGTVASIFRQDIVRLRRYGGYWRNEFV